jgi:hypothetical protein
VLVQPTAIGPFTFGSSVAVQTGTKAKPGAFSVTTLHARNGEEAKRVQELSQQIASELLETPGFLGWVGMTIGQRMITVTAWENPEDSRQLMTGGTHKKAVAEFFGPSVASSGFTSVWIPDRINPMWVRCGTCEQMCDSEQAGGACRCGAPLPETQPYW